MPTTTPPKTVYMRCRACDLLPGDYLVASQRKVVSARRRRDSVALTLQTSDGLRHQTSFRAYTYIMIERTPA